MSDDLIRRLAEAGGHTPGPWHTEEACDGPSYREISTPRGGLTQWAAFARVVVRMNDTYSAEGVANSNLIALAPEMRARILADATEIVALRAENERLTHEREHAWSKVAESDALLCQGLAGGVDDKITIRRLTRERDHARARAERAEACLLRMQTDAASVLAQRDAAIRDALAAGGYPGGDER